MLIEVEIHQDWLWFLILLQSNLYYSHQPSCHCEGELLSFVLLRTFFAKHAVYCIDLADVQLMTTELNTTHWNICGWRCLILLVFLLHGYTYIFTGRHGGSHCGGGKHTAVVYLATGHGGLGRVVQLNQKQI